MPPSAARGRAKSATTPEEVMRGVAGGVILGLPLIYTQEVWTLGASIHPLAILLLLATSFALNLVLSRYVGFEDPGGMTPTEDAVVGIGLSALLAAGLLFLLDRIRLGMSFENALGVVALCTVPTSLGFALGNALAPREGAEGSDKLKEGAGDLIAAAGGAIVLSLNIAPTEEVLLVSSQLGFVRLGILVAVSLTLSYMIVFYAEFKGRRTRIASKGAVNTPATETALAYVVAFGVAGLLLIAFGQIDKLDLTALPPITVLSFPAAMGAALGRVLV